VAVKLLNAALAAHPSFPVSLLGEVFCTDR
jgi:hypothetical protein